MTDYPIRFTDDGFHQYRLDKKKSSIQGTHVTFTHGIAHALTIAHKPMVLLDETQTQSKGDDALMKHNEKVETKPFKYVSLFSGIGGFEQALNKLGGTCVMASEIDKFANQAYEVLYGHKTVGNITKVAAEDVPDHDLLVGGFPCQAFSVAGKRLGFEDTRGTLFFEMARIAKAKQPKAILAENVKGLISHDKGKTLNTIVQTLCDIGYTVDFNVLNSKYFGVPQNRERIFIVAVRDDLITPEPWEIEGTNVVAKGKKRIGALAGVKTFNFDWPGQTEVTVRLRDILESDVDERFYLDEEKTAKLVAQLESRGEPQVLRPQRTEYGKQIRKEYEAGKIKESRHHMTELQPRDDGMCNTLTSVQKDNLLAEPQTLGHVDLKGHDAINREPKIDIEQFSQGNGVSCCIDANYSKGTATGDVGKGRRTHVMEEVRPVLTPDRIEKRQNGRRFKDSDEPAFTLTAQDRHGVAIGEKPRYRIRKLTPLECFRLQGFPDSAHQALVNAGISNSQLYKMAGNAVTVNVVKAIANRIIKYL